MRIKDLEPFEAEWIAEGRGQVEALWKRQSGCPSVRLLRAALADALPQESQAAITRHIAGCKTCASIQADLQQVGAQADITQEETRRILSRVRRERLREDGGPFALRIFSWRVAFATLTLAFCVLLVVQRMDTPDRPSSPASTVSSQMAAQDAPEALRLDKPDVKLSLAVLTWRGDDNTGQQYLADIGPALDLYRADRFADAARGLETLSAKYSGSVEIFFYLGASRLFLEDHAAAVQALEKADRLAPDSFAADVSWYLALAYQRSGRLADAHARLASLAAGTSPYAARARAAIEALKSPTVSR